MEFVRAYLLINLNTDKKFRILIIPKPDEIVNWYNRYRKSSRVKVIHLRHPNIMTKGAV